MELWIIAGIIGLLTVCLIVSDIRERKLKKENAQLTADTKWHESMSKSYSDISKQMIREQTERDDKLREEYEVKLKTGIKNSRDGQRSAIKGQMAEQIAPFFKEFKWNPKDARFMGSPIDFVVFDGMSDGNLREIILVEIKTGKGALTKIQRNIRDKVLHDNVSFEVIKLPDGEEREDDRKTNN